MAGSSAEAARHADTGPGELGASTVRMHTVASPPPPEEGISVLPGAPAQQ